MAKYIPDAVLDVALAEIADNGDRLDICSQQPATYAEVATYSLGYTALTPGDGNGDYDIADGDTSGRKLTVAEQTFAGTDTGTGNHIVITDTVAEAIKAITTCDNYSVQDTVNLTVNAFDIWEIRDPT